MVQMSPPIIYTYGVNDRHLPCDKYCIILVWERDYTGRIGRRDDQLLSMYVHRQSRRDKANIRGQLKIYLIIRCRINTSASGVRVWERLCIINLFSKFQQSAGLHCAAARSKYARFLLKSFAVLRI